MNNTERPLRLPSVERPWMKYYKAELINQPIPSGTVYEFLYDNNCEYPDDIAILYQNIKITYRQLFRQIDDCARAFMAIGVRRNDIVTMAMVSTPEAIVVFYALNRLGAIANLIHPLANAEDICFYLNEVKSKVFVMFNGTWPIVKDVLSKSSVEKAIVVSPVEALSPAIKLVYQLKAHPPKVKEAQGVMTWKHFLRLGKGVELSEPMRADDDWAAISHTGGTTGAPKGVICTNFNYVAVPWQATLGRQHDRQESLMVTLPPFINYSLANSIIESLSFGLKTVLIPKYEPEKFIEYITRYSVNHIPSIPAYWKRILDLPVKKGCYSKLGFIVSGGEGLDVSTEEAINERLRQGGAKVELMKGTGMTELTSGVSNTYADCNVKGSVGIPYIMTNCRVVDVQTGEELSYNEEGELCFSGPTIMVGYYNNPEATADIIKTDADGTRWLHTGDVGYITEDGVVFITGRIKRLIMQKDNNGMVSKIFPERIESIISQMSAIEECCVVGKPHPDRISLPVAYVVLTPGTRQEGGAIAQAVVDWCRDRLPAYMVPVEVHVLDVMPRTDRGKIDYRSLEERSAATER